MTRRELEELAMKNLKKRKVSKAQREVINQLIDDGLICGSKGVCDKWSLNRELIVLAFGVGIIVGGLCANGGWS